MDGRGREVVEKLSPNTKLLRGFHGTLKNILSPDSPTILLRWIYDQRGRRAKKKEGEKEVEERMARRRAGRIYKILKKDKRSLRPKEAFKSKKVYGLTIYEA